ncbi:MAG: 50S ribosomal protein L13 [Candidatus Aenigmarchaeota archaeon]|nr:50S ribosomal protein L13 [Candidatus Aenigmarchaeota archaeon]
MIIDATDKILGRMATFVAQKALAGEDVVIINAEKAIMSGSKKGILNKFKARRDRGDSIHGPHYPRMPDKIVRRAIRGMLPTTKASGTIAYKKVKVYIGTPEGIKADDIKLNSKENLKDKRYMILEDICEWLGAKWK